MNFSPPIINASSQFNNLNDTHQSAASRIRCQANQDPNSSNACSSNPSDRSHTHSRLLNRVYSYFVPLHTTPQQQTSGTPVARNMVTSTSHGPLGTSARPQQQTSTVPTLAVPAQINNNNGGQNLGIALDPSAAPRRPRQQTPVPTSALTLSTHQVTNTMIPILSFDDCSDVNINIFESLPLFQKPIIVKPATLLVSDGKRKEFNDTCMPWCSVKCPKNHMLDTMYVEFALSDAHLNTLSKDKEHKLLLRFCALLDYVPEFSDTLPYHLLAYVNGQRSCLPKAWSIWMAREPRQVPYEPWDITNLLMLDTTLQRIEFAWIQEPLWNKYGILRLPECRATLFNSECQKFCFALHLVHQKTFDELLKHVREKNQPIPRANTISSIASHYHESEDQDFQVSLTKLQVSLICPLGKTRVVTPCQSVNCHHVQVMDALNFLKLNHKTKSSMWLCPICNETSSLKDLRTVEYFCDVIKSPRLLETCSDVQLNKDGTWEPVNTKKGRHCKIRKPRESRLNDSIQILEEDEDNEVEIQAEEEEGVLQCSVSPTSLTSDDDTPLHLSPGEKSGGYFTCNDFELSFPFEVNDVGAMQTSLDINSNDHQSPNRESFKTPAADAIIDVLTPKLTAMAKTNPEVAQRVQFGLHTEVVTSSESEQFDTSNELFGNIDAAEISKVQESPKTNAKSSTPKYVMQCATAEILPNDQEDNFVVNIQKSKNSKVVSSQANGKSSKSKHAECDLAKESPVVVEGQYRYFTRSRARAVQQELASHQPRAAGTKSKLKK